MGGVGREAHTGSGGRVGSVRSTLKRAWSMLDLCRLNDGNSEGNWSCCECCMEPGWLGVGWLRPSWRGARG